MNKPIHDSWFDKLTTNGFVNRHMSKLFMRGPLRLTGLPKPEIPGKVRLVWAHQNMQNYTPSGMNLPKNGMVSAIVLSQ